MPVNAKRPNSPSRRILAEHALEGDRRAKSRHARVKNLQYHLGAEAESRLKAKALQAKSPTIEHGGSAMFASVLIVLVQGPTPQRGHDA